MQINQAMLNQLQRLNDAQLSMIIRKLREAGVDLNAYGIPDGDISRVREVLRNAGPADIARANEQYAQWKQQQKQDRRPKP